MAFRQTLWKIAAWVAMLHRFNYVMVRTNIWPIYLWATRGSKFKSFYRIVFDCFFDKANLTQLSNYLGRCKGFWSWIRYAGCVFGSTLKQSDGRIGTKDFCQKQSSSKLYAEVGNVWRSLAIDKNKVKFGVLVRKVSWCHTTISYSIVKKKALILRMHGIVLRKRF